MMEYIRCPSCGDEVSTKYRPVNCYKCGPIDPALVPALPAPDPDVIAAIPSHIILTSVSLLFCCLPALGGVMYSLMVMHDKKKGDWVKAERHSRFAMECAIAAYILGILALIAKWRNSL